MGFGIGQDVNGIIREVCALARAFGNAIDCRIGKRSRRLSVISHHRYFLSKFQYLIHMGKGACINLSYPATSYYNCAMLVVKPDTKDNELPINDLSVLSE